MNKLYHKCPTCGRTVLSKSQLIRGVCAKCYDEFEEIKRKANLDDEVKNSKLTNNQRRNFEEL
jgi:DNA-directed RNA polymerase subunit RPC12/RpoP